MVIELENKDIERIVSRVLEALKPVLQDRDRKSDQGEIIFDVEGLANYLKVSKAWVYEKTHLKEIPFYKVGKFPRFIKKHIDRWLQENLHLPLSPLPNSGKMKLLK